MYRARKFPPLWSLCSFAAAGRLRFRCFYRRCVGRLCLLLFNFRRAHNLIIRAASSLPFSSRRPPLTHPCFRVPSILSQQQKVSLSWWRLNGLFTPGTLSLSRSFSIPPKTSSPAPCFPLPSRSEARRYVLCLFCGVGGLVRI